MACQGYTMWYTKYDGLEDYYIVSFTIYNVSSRSIQDSQMVFDHPGIFEMYHCTHVMKFL